MTSGKIDEPIKPQGALKGVNLESLLESITLLAEDDGRSIEELEAEALAAEKQREEERRTAYERLGLIDRGFPRRAIDCLDEVTGEDVYKRQGLHGTKSILPQPVRDCVLFRTVGRLV